jgi:hypothetical protein
MLAWLGYVAIRHNMIDSVRETAFSVCMRTYAPL